VVYLLKTRAVEAHNSRCYVMARIHAAKERVRYAVTSRETEEVLQADFSVGQRRARCYATVR
jgi:hypothetical protein